MELVSRASAVSVLKLFQVTSYKWLWQIIRSSRKEKEKRGRKVKETRLDPVCRCDPVLWAQLLLPCPPPKLHWGLEKCQGLLSLRPHGLAAVGTHVHCTSC